MKANKFGSYLTIWSFVGLYSYSKKQCSSKSERHCFNIYFFLISILFVIVRIIFVEESVTSVYGLFGNKNRSELLESAYDYALCINDSTFLINSILFVIYSKRNCKLHNSRLKLQKKFKRTRYAPFLEMRLITNFFCYLIPFCLSLFYKMNINTTYEYYCIVLFNLDNVICLPLCFGTFHFLLNDLATFINEIIEHLVHLGNISAPSDDFYHSTIKTHKLIDKVSNIICMMKKYIKR